MTIAAALIVGGLVSLSLSSVVAMARGVAR